MSVKIFPYRLRDKWEAFRRAWTWLRKFKQYKLDYERQEREVTTFENKKLGWKDYYSRKHKKLAKEMFDKYGFYDLVNPQDHKGEFPGEFVRLPEFVLKEKTFESGLIFFMDRKKRFPESVTIKIDLRKPLNYILQNIEFYLKDIKKRRGIKTSRPVRLTDFDLLYKAKVLMKSGYKKTEVRKILFASREGESRLRAADRVINKLSLLEQSKKL